MTPMPLLAGNRPEFLLEIARVGLQERKKDASTDSIV